MQATGGQVNENLALGPRHTNCTGSAEYPDADGLLDPNIVVSTSTTCPSRPGESAVADAHPR